MFLLRAHWSWRQYERRRPGDKAHNWWRFCCDSFFSWISLKSLRHCFRTHCGTGMANVEQGQQMIPLITCESFPWSVCLRIGFRCRCIWFDLALGIQMNSIKQQFKSNSVSPGWWENWTFEGTPSIWFKTLIIPWDLWSLSEIWIVFPKD